MTKSPRRNPILSRSISTLLALGALAAMQSAQASNIWDGGGTTDNWSDLLNWDDDATPGFGTLTFSGSTRTTNVNDSITSMNMLLWTGTSAWTLNQGGATVLSLSDNSGLQAKLENQSTGLVTINAPITFGATAGAAWGEINAVNGGLTFGSAGTLTVNGSAVNGIRMFGAGRTTTFNNTVSAPGKYFTTAGATGGTVEVGGAFTSGDFYLMNGSTLKLNTGGSLTTSGLRLGGDLATTGAQDLTKGATFQLTDLAGGQTFSSNINSVTGNTSGALLVDSLNTSGTNTLSGSVFLDAPLKFQQAAGGTLAITGVVSNGSSLTKTGAGTLSLSGANTFGGVLTVANGNLSIATINNASSDGVLGNSANAVILGAGGAATGTLQYTGATASSSKAFTVASAGIGAFQIDNAATELTLSAAMNNTAATSTFLKTGPGTLTLTGGGTLGTNGATGFFGLNLRQGTLRLNGGAYTVTGEAALGDNVTAGGAGNNVNLTLDAGSLNVTSWFSLARGNGVGGVSSDVVLNNNAAITTANLGGGYNNNNGLNLPKGSLTLNGSSTFTVSNNGTNFNLAESAGSNITVTLNGSSTFTHNPGTAARSRIGLAGKALFNIASPTATGTFQAVQLGITAGGSGALWNKGNLNINGAASVGVNLFPIANASNSYGYFRNDNGAATTPTVTIQEVGFGGGAGGGTTAATAGTSVVDLASGTINIGSWFAMNRNQTATVFQDSQLNINGGTLKLSNIANQNFMNWAASTTGVQNSTINVTGTGVLGSNGTVSELSVNSNNAAGNTGIVTLAAGGTAQVTSLKSTVIFSNTATTSGSSYVNFNNGTLKGNAASATWLANSLTGVFLHSGGATFDTNGVNLTIPKPLLTPTGNGLSSIPISTNGAGYIGRPLVKITGGGGVGASAMADFDPVTGTVTGITITSPGSGYTSAPTITLVGGGAATAATLGTVTIGAVTGGGITKSGLGTLTLTGASTFNGPVTVNGGTLLASLGNNTNNPVTSALGNPQAARNLTVNNGGTLQFNLGDTLGSAITNVVSTLVINSGGVVTNTAGNFNTFGPVQLNGGTLTGNGGATAAYQMYNLRGTVTVGGTAASTIASTGTNAGYHLAAPTTFDVADATAGPDLNVSGSLIDQDGTHTGAGALTKIGAGTMALSGVSAYTGATSVSNGTLLLGGSGAMNTTSGITVNGAGAKFVQTSSTAVTPTVTLTAGTVDGTAQIGTVNAAAGTFIANGNGGTGALTIGTLTFGGAATMNLSTASNAAVLNTTTLTTGGNLITVNATNSGWTNGQVYDLVSYSTLNGAFGEFLKGTIANLGARQSATLTNPAGFISLSIAGDLPVWTGLENGNWTTNPIGGLSNWKLQTQGTATDYLTNDTVLFDDTVATGTTAVNISDANVSPISTTFSNSSKNYTVSSTGGFGIASGFLLKNGTGSLTIGTANTYTGATTLNDGTTNLTGSLGNTAVTVAGPATLNLQSAGAISQNTVTVNGTLTQNIDNALSGTAALVLNNGATLANANTYSGGTTLNAGTLNLGGASAVGTGATTQNGGTLNLNAASALGSSALTLHAGTLNLNHASGLGTGLFTISGGTIDNNSGAGITLTSNNAQVWTNNASVAFTGTNALDLGTGAVTFGADAATASFTITNHSGLAGTSLTVGGAITSGLGGAPGTKTLNIAGSSTALTGSITKGAANALVINDTVAGTLTLSGAASSITTLNLNGGAGSIVDLGAGNLSVANGGASIVQSTTGGTINGSGSLVLGSNAGDFGTAGGTTLTVNAKITGANGVDFYNANGGFGTIALTAANTWTGATNIENSKVILTGSINAANTGNIGQLTVGDIGGVNALLSVEGGTINATKNTAPSLAVGSVAGAVGAIHQSSGTISTTSEFHLGRGVGTGAYAAHTMSGGTLTSGSWFVVGLNNDRAVLSQSGGTISVNANRLTVGAGGTGSFGVANLSGNAVFNATSGSGGAYIGESGVGVLNVTGSAALNLATNGLRIGQNAGSNGIVNLNGGTITTNFVATNLGASSFNFNGGTLKANAASTTFMQGLTSAYVRSGGATIDDGGFAITIAQPLLAPAGNGVSSIAVTGGTGYIDTPLVQITGDGTGATAVANLDASGNLTGITITNPGINYTTATATLLGGGGSGATVDPANLAANTSGGLTKNGAGTLTLSSASTYTGTTQINAGTLLVTNTTGSATGTGPVTLSSGTALTGNGTISGAVTVPSTASITPGNAGAGTLTVGALTLSAGAIINEEITDAGTLDRITVTNAGGLTINGGGYNLYQTGAVTTFETNGVYNLIGYSGAIGGTGPAALSVLNPSDTKAYAFGSAAGFVTLTISTAGGTPNFWNVNAAGNWTTGANWTLGSAPDGVSNIANFGGGGATLTAPRTVTLDADQTIGSLGFNSAQSYTISGTKTLTLDNGIDPNAQIANTNGNHTLGVNLAAVSANTQFNVANAVDTLTFSGELSGGTNVQKLGPGTVTFSGSNSYFGTNTVTGGTLALSGVGKLGDATNPLALAGGNVDLGGTSQTVGAVTISAGNLTNGSITPDSLTYNSTGASIVSANVGGFADVTKNGVGTLTLSGNNTYLGTTFANAGTLIVSSANALGDATAPVTFSGATLQIDGTAFTTLGTRTLTGFPAAVVVSDSGHTVTIGQDVFASTTLVKQGPGKLLLTGTDTFSDTLSPSVQAGTLEISGTFSGANVNGGGGIEIAPTAGSVATLNVVPGATVNTARVIIGGNTPNTGNPGAGTLNQTGGTINARQWFTVGSGAGTNASTASGVFTMTGGVLNASTVGTQSMEVANFAGATGAVTMSGSAAINLHNNASIALGANNNAGNGTFTQDGGTVTFYSDGGVTVGGTGALRLGSAGTLPASSTYTYNLNGGMLTVPAITRTAGTSVFNFNGGTLRPTATNANYIANTIATNVKAGGAKIDTNGFDVTITGALAHDAGLGATADGGLVKQGAGLLSLTGASTFTGDVDIQTGTLVANRGNNVLNPVNSALGNPQVARNINVQSGATLQFVAGDTLGGASTNVQATLVINGGTVTNAGNNFTTLGPVVLNGGTLTTTGGAIAGYQSYNLLGSVTVGGTAASTISGSGAFAGYHLNTNTVFNVAEVAAGTDLAVSGTLLNRNATLGGAGGLTKTGAGTMALSGTNTYTGPTVVEAGTLALSGSISGSDAITVKQGAMFDVSGVGGGFMLAGGQTLKGPGTVVGSVALAANSALSPGESPGTTTFSGNLNLTLAVTPTASAALVFELGATSDQVVLSTGALNIGTGVLAFDDFVFSDTGSLAQGTYTLFDTSSPITGTLDPNALTGSIGGFSGTLAFGDSGHDLVLEVLTVPEPSSGVTLFGGFATLLGLQRFRRRRR